MTLPTSRKAKKRRGWRNRHPVRFFKKWIYQRLFDSHREKVTLFVFGCQRSGTSVFTQLFQNDLSSKVYGEKGLSDARTPGRDGRYRLLADDRVRERMSRERATLLVSKPLVESQNARRILDAFPSARAVWMVRSFADVAFSGQRRFSRDTAMRNLRHLVDENAEPGFASEHVAAETREIVRKYFSESMTGDEAQILFWYVRNRLYFDQELEAHERVLVCCYEDFVADPDKIMRTVYEFIGRAFPGSKMTAGVHRNSVDRRVRLEANPELVALCKQLHEALKAVACQ